MIEVALAMAIIAFGMTSILGLIPVGLNASRNAIAETFCGDTVDLLMTYISAKANATSAEYNNFFGTSGIITATPPTETAINDWSKAFLDNDGTVTIIPGWDNLYKCDNKQIYFVVQGGNAANSGYDFSAALALWKSPVTSNMTLDTGTATYTDNNYSAIAGLNIEISWPLGKKYADREKRYYYFEIAKP